jgi:hypothetical protein
MALKASKNTSPWILMTSKRVSADAREKTPNRAAEIPLPRSASSKNMSPWMADNS